LAADFDDLLRLALTLFAPLANLRGFFEKVHAGLVRPEHVEVIEVDLVACFKNCRRAVGGAASIGRGRFPRDRQKHERGLLLGER